MAKIQADYSALQNDFKKRCEEVLNKVSRKGVLC